MCIRDLVRVYVILAHWLEAWCVYTHKIMHSGGLIMLSHLLLQLSDEDGLWEAVGDSIVEFVQRISKKTKAHFGMGSESQELFLTVPTWKRAMVYMHLLRYVLGKPNMKAWDKFDVRDYKGNVRAVNRYSKLDLAILKRSPKFRSLPEKLVGCSDPVQITRIRRRSNNIFTSENETDSPSKKRCAVGQSSSEEEDVTMLGSQIQSD